jgi:hypothetical protein
LLWCACESLSVYPVWNILNFCMWKSLFFNNLGTVLATISFFFFFFGGVNTGVWIQGLELLGKCSTTWTKPPALYALFFHW